MALRDDDGFMISGTIAEAFASAGLPPEVARLQALIDGTPNDSALWLKLTKDKLLASAAMKALRAWRGAGLSAAPVERQARVREVIQESGNRKARRDAARKAVEAKAVEWVRVAEQKVIQRALSTFRLIDGSLLCKRHWYELAYIARNNEREAKIARAVMKLARPPSDKVLVGDVISPDQFDKILEAESV